MNWDCKFKIRTNFEFLRQNSKLQSQNSKFEVSEFSKFSVKIQVQGKLIIGGKYIRIVRLLGTEFLARKFKVFFKKMFWRKNSKLQFLIIHEFLDILNFRAKNDEIYIVTVRL